MGQITVRELNDKLNTQRILSTIAGVLPGRMEAKSFITKVYLYARLNPKIMECSEDSIMNAVMLAANMGLWPDSQSQLLHLVPFWNNDSKCKILTVIPGYKGLIDLMHRCADVIDVEAQVVRVGDEFRMTRGTDPFIVHNPEWVQQEIREGHADSRDLLGPIVAAYAIATFKNGLKKFEALPIVQVNQIRDNVRGYDPNKAGHIWNKHYEPMVKKTLIRQLVKYIPHQPALALALNVDDQSAQGVEYDAKALDPESDMGEKEVPATKAEAIEKKLEPESWGPFGAYMAKLRADAGKGSAGAASFLSVSEPRFMSMELHGDPWPNEVGLITAYAQMLGADDVVCAELFKLMP